MSMYFTIYGGLRDKQQSEEEMITLFRLSTSRARELCELCPDFEVGSGIQPLYTGYIKEVIIPAYEKCIKELDILKQRVEEEIQYILKAIASLPLPNSDIGHLVKEMLENTSDKREEINNNNKLKTGYQELIDQLKNVCVLIALNQYRENEWQLYYSIG